MQRAALSAQFMRALTQRLYSLRDSTLGSPDATELARATTAVTGRHSVHWQPSPSRILCSAILIGDAHRNLPAHTAHLRDHDIFRRLLLMTKQRHCLSLLSQLVQLTTLCPKRQLPRILSSATRLLISNWPASLVNNDSYKGCVAPAAHMIATIPGVVTVHSWDKLPIKLADAGDSF